MKHLLRTSVILLLGFSAVSAMAEDLTHFGKNFQRHVTLQLRQGATQCFGGRGFFQRFPAGDLASEQFVVPGGNILVITDFTWEATRQPQASFIAGRMLKATLWSRFGAQANRLAYTAPAINVTPDLAGMERIGGSSIIASGVQVGTGRSLCGFANSWAINSIGHTLQAAEVSGYLIEK